MTRPVAFYHVEKWRVSRRFMEGHVNRLLNFTKYVILSLHIKGIYMSILARKNITIVEPFDLIDSSHSINLTNYRLFQFLIGNIYIKGDGIVEDRLYQVPLADYAEYFNITSHSAYRTLLEAVDTFSDTVIDISTNLIDPSASKTSRTKLRFFDRIDYDPSNSVIQVRWSRELATMYNSLELTDKYYAKYFLECTREMKSVNSIRLFRILNKWIKVRRKEFTLLELRRLMGFLDNEYHVWDNFRRAILIPSIADIHKYTNIEVVMDRKCVGRKVVGVMFTLNVFVEEIVETIAGKHIDSEEDKIEQMSKYDFVLDKG